MKKFADYTISQLQHLIAAENSSSAFEELYLRVYKNFHQFAFRIIKSNHIADEIVSDVFIQVWKKRENLPSINNLRLFLYIAVKNQSLTYLYKSRREKTCWIEEYANEPDFDSSVYNPEQVMIANELQLSYVKTINKLPPKCKAVFKLIKEDGLKYAEAAKILNLSIKTVENQMGIAYKKITLALKPSLYSRQEKKRLQK
jgi:RNA polymerase sigma-70 factor (family 1)